MSNELLFLAENRLSSDLISSISYLSNISALTLEKLRSMSIHDTFVAYSLTVRQSLPIYFDVQQVKGNARLYFVHIIVVYIVQRYRYKFLRYVVVLYWKYFIAIFIIWCWTCPVIFLKLIIFHSVMDKLIDNMQNKCDLSVT